MNYDVVRTGAKSAVKYLNINPEKYAEAMKVFYTEGKKNPSVARIIMQDEIRLGAAESAKTQAELSDTFDSFKKVCLKKNYLGVEESANQVKSIINESLHELKNDTAVFNDIINLKKMYFTKLLDSLHILTKKSPKEAELVKADFDNTFAQLYPKTKNIREYIAKYNMRMQKTTPLLDKKEKKLLLLEPEKGWMTLYPKSAYKRLLLHRNEKYPFFLLSEKRAIAKELVDFELFKNNRMLRP